MKNLILAALGLASADACVWLGAWGLAQFKLEDWHRMPIFATAFILLVLSAFAAIFNFVVWLDSTKR